MVQVLKLNADISSHLETGCHPDNQQSFHDDACNKLDI